MILSRKNGGKFVSLFIVDLWKPPILDPTIVRNDNRDIYNEEKIFF